MNRIPDDLPDEAIDCITPDGRVVLPADDTRIEPRPVLVRLSEVRPEPVTWLWPGRLAVGKVTLAVGDPGLGKSFVALDCAARVSAGLAWPDGAPPTSIGDVLLLSAEDGLADTIRPRLDALGADVTHVHYLGILRAGDREREIQLADTSALEQAIRETASRLLIIDPVSAYLGKSDSHRDADVRALLKPLKELAEQTGVAVLGVMHLSKSTQQSALYRTVGSIAFTAAARIVLGVAKDPGRDDRSILAPIKQNLSAPPAKLAYSFVDGRIVWSTQDVPDVDINELLAGPPPLRDRDEQTDAERVIEQLLDDDEAWPSSKPLPATVAIEAANANGINLRTLRWTARKLGIRAAKRKGGFGKSGGWEWHRPTCRCEGCLIAAERADKGATIGATSPERNRVATFGDVAALVNSEEIDVVSTVGESACAQSGNSQAVERVASAEPHRLEVRFRR